MRIGEITKSETLYELEKWAKRNIPLLEDGSMDAERLSQTLLQKAVNKFKKQPEPSEEKTKEMQDYMDQLEMKLGTEKVEKTTIQKLKTIIAHAYEENVHNNKEFKKICQH